MKLRKLVEFVPGLNPSRINSKDLEKYSFYDKESFEKDLLFEDMEDYRERNFDEEALLEGEIIFYSLSNQMAFISESNAGKIPSINFSRVKIISNKIDKSYLLYLFNENQIIQRQIDRERQGILLLKLPLRLLYDIDIPMIPMKDQKKIGKIYIDSIKLKSKMKRYSKLLESATMHLLSEKVREEYDKRRYTKK